MSEYVVTPKMWKDHQQENADLRDEIQRLQIVVKYFSDTGQPARDIIKNLMKEG